MSASVHHSVPPVSVSLVVELSAPVIESVADIESLIESVADIESVIELALIELALIEPRIESVADIVALWPIVSVAESFSVSVAEPVPSPGQSCLSCTSPSSTHGSAQARGASATVKATAQGEPGIRYVIAPL